MATVGYILFGAHFMLLMRFLFVRKSNAIFDTVVFCIAAAYFGLAVAAPHLVPALFVLEAVAVVRFVVSGLFTTAGSSVSRHTQKVFSKALWSSLFTWLLACGLMFFTLDLSLVKVTFHCGPIFFVIEYGMRLMRARNAKRLMDSSKPSDSKGK